MDSSSTPPTKSVVWSSGWSASGRILVFSLLLIGVAYWSTYADIIHLWLNNDTFAHGPLIPAIIIYLLWQKRAEIACVTPQAEPLAIIFILGLSIFWLLGYAADIAVAQQFSAIALLPAMTWLILGTRVVTLIAFPLAYFIFAVPIGEFLIPVLQHFTAAFVVKALQATGVPVLWEGLFFYLPDGAFEVAKACSGVRYLIASLALGTLYSYLNYTSFWRRFLFIVVAAVVPVIANGIRAYGIVMIAHLSDYSLAVGVDHILYGWVFFGLVMFLMFWIGSFFKEPDSTAQLPEPANSAVNESLPIGVFPGKQLGWTIFALLLSVSAAGFASWIDARENDNSVHHVVLPSKSLAWSGPDEGSHEWQPDFAGSKVYRGAYRENIADSLAVDVFIAYYRQQSQGGELINVMNKVYNREQTRLLHADGDVGVLLSEGRQWQVLETQVVSGDDNKRLIWQWYEVAGSATTNRVIAKFYEVRRRLLSPAQGSAAIVISSRYELSPDEARQRMTGFLNEMLLPLRNSVTQ